MFRLQALMLITAIALAIVVSGCATTSGTGALGGAGAGALTGGIIGHQQGKGAEGAGIGALVGGLIGHAAGQEVQNRRQVAPRYNTAPTPSYGNPGVEGAYSSGRGQYLQGQQRMLEGDAYMQGLRGR